MPPLCNLYDEIISARERDILNPSQVLGRCERYRENYVTQRGDRSRLNLDLTLAGKT